MQRKNPMQSYRETAIQTATPGHLILMLYEGAIRFAEQSLEGFQHKDPKLFNETIHNNVKRAQAIVRQLNDSLNMRQGGGVAANFRRLYDYLDGRLQEGNVRKTKEPIEDVISRLCVLRDSWAEMLQGPRHDLDPEAALQAA